MARKKYATVGPMERAERARRNGEKINRNCPPCAAGPHGDPPAAGPGAGATGPGSLSVPPFGAANENRKICEREKGLRKRMVAHSCRVTFSGGVDFGGIPHGDAAARALCR